MKAVHMIAFILLVIGGLNWLLTAFNWNVVEMVFGAKSALTQIIYVLVGLSAIEEVITHKKNCRYCNPGGAM